ncbi:MULTISPECIES: phage major tail tube protein [Dickeya]|uniref:Phage major tail tube protein n=1 Tax=Dickeya aquatica TaxID=1401087 RepID=A0A375A9M4_9GAMM|nr:MULTISPECIES: phage major tail tube protein [Dickeya]SLM62812.1 Phage major tail tube protein [Dickeya aquatica]
MALPKKLKYFNMFIDGDSYLGMIPELTLPKLSRKMEDYQGGGMPGSVSIDLGLEAGALDMELTMGGVDARLLKKYGSPSADAIQFRFAGSYQSEDTGLSIPVEVQTRGRYTEVDTGSAKMGDDTTNKFTLKNTYYKLTIDGEDVIEIDVINAVFKSGGVDRMEQHRANMGL